MSVQIRTTEINREAATKMSNFKFACLMVYNTIVVVATALSVYYVSGWMFFLLAAVMKLSKEED